MPGLPRDPVVRAALVVFLVAAIGAGWFFLLFLHQVRPDHCATLPVAGLQQFRENLRSSANRA